MELRHPLNEKWELTFTAPGGEKIHTSVSVPSNVEPVLQKLGLIEDYLPADRIDATDAFKLVDDWCYSLCFDSPALPQGHRRELVFEGIDTIAQIYLNGEQICDCRNMHLTYRVDVTEKLLPAGNRLQVTLRSAELWARQHCHGQNAAFVGFPGHYGASAYLRKARHQWGWDNAPCLVTAGIVRPVYLQDIPPCRFEDVYLYTADITKDHAVIGAHWYYHTDRLSLQQHEVRLTLLENGQTVFTNTKPCRFVQGASQYQIPLKGLKLWWPAGFGEPHLYNLKLEMLHNGAVTACYEAPFGIRKVQLKRTEDLQADGSGAFDFYINGQPIFIRGTNWKPLDPLVSLADAKLKTMAALQELKNLHCNMVRIWGGGIYEPPLFYEYCDRNGILVWQDFMMACEMPPTDDFACSLYKEEAEQVIRRLRNHTCLALWCGDNENDKCIFWLHPRANLLPSYNAITRKVFKQAVLEQDPYRDYIESSPYISDRAFKEMQDGEIQHPLPEIHFYPNAVEFHQKLRECPAKFIGEVGPMPVNAITVNKQIMEREYPRLKRLWNAPPMPTDPPHHFDTLHQDDNYFTLWRNSGKALCQDRYGKDFTLEEFKDYALAINFSCAEIYKDVVEYYRISRPAKTGVLWWSLYDMWPMLYNYSVIDCYGVRKLPYFWLKQAQQDFALIVTRAKGHLTLFAANDTMTEHTVQYTVTAYDPQGKETLVTKGTHTQGANAVSALATLEEQGAKLLILHWQEKGNTYVNHAVTGKAPFEVIKRWTPIIGKECGFLQDITEL